MVGTTLHHYRIKRALGSGGMGDVYLAEDSTLHREVALKVLAPRIASDPESLRRFQVEATAVAALNHPGIVTIHSVEEADGIHFLTMEFVEGQTLSEVIPAGGLPVPQAIDIAVQLSDAIDAAHRRGIVHRDIKPGNVMLTASGVKVLDFGLAKLIGTSGQVVERTMTVTGLIVGTPQYMAPEQIEGRPVDHRTDIFALGAVIYEMVTGRKAFEGTGAASAMADVLARDPPILSQIRPAVPAALDAVVRKCLAKNPDERWQSARDLRDLLRWVRDHTWPDGEGRQVSEPAAAGARSRRWLLATAALLVGVGLAIPAVLMWPRRSADTPGWPQGAIRFTVAADGVQGAPALSPDGRHLAFASVSNNQSGIWVRALAESDARLLPGTAGATNPFWSPDGKSIAFYADGALRRVDLSGGVPQTLWPVAVGASGSWGSSGVIVFPLRQVLHQIPAAGGTATPLTTLDLSRQENSHRFPHFFPDGRRFLFVARSGRPENNVAYLASLDGGPPMRLFHTVSAVRSAPPGYLLFVRDDTLHAQRFDATAGRLTGEAVAIASPVGSNTVALAGSFAVSESGVLAYRASEERLSQFAWFDRQGRKTATLGEPGLLSYFRIAPDERRVALDLTDRRLGSRSIWIQDFGTGARARLTFAGSHDWIPVWSPDGSQLLFNSYRDGPLNFYRKPVSGAGGDQPVYLSSKEKYVHDWSPDGRFIAYMEGNTAQELDVLVRRIDGSGSPISIARSRAIEFYPRFSPDGRWIAYGSAESGSNEVYVQPFPPTGGKWQISSGGGNFARWRGDGRELFYVAPDRRMMAVDVSPTPSFAVGPPRLLFRVAEARVDNSSYAYEVTRDGQRFLVNTLRPDPTASGITVVLNWTVGLRR